jgi:hypothetical protein
MRSKIGPGYASHNRTKVLCAFWSKQAPYWRLESIAGTRTAVGAAHALPGSFSGFRLGPSRARIEVERLGVRTNLGNCAIEEWISIPHKGPAICGLGGEHNNLCWLPNCL